MREVKINRETKETNIHLCFDAPDARDFAGSDAINVTLDVPFFTHMLRSFMFHGGFHCDITAQGDIAVDPHHTVEDVGIVLGMAIHEMIAKHGSVQRFGSAVIPMDDALAEVVMDIGGRGYMVYTVDYPQPYAGDFDLSLIREFFQALADNARANIHVLGRYAVNGHHLAEAVFKAAGCALSRALAPAKRTRSIK